MPYETPPLPYAYDALEPHYDARTVEIHHDKHHVAYTTKLNAAVEKHPELAARPIEDVLRSINDVPGEIRQAVINHGGGHYHHTFFWNIMGPGKGGQPKGGALTDDIKRTFGSFDAFKEQFAGAAMNRFGSGWAWLGLDQNGRLHICDTHNQDSPLSRGHTPILTIDVWEHAYYLKYQNRRADWIAAWWNLVNWDAVAELYDAARK